MLAALMSAVASRETAAYQETQARRARFRIPAYPPRMTAPRRELVIATVVLVLVLAIEAAGLRSGRVGLILIGLILALSAAVLVLQTDVRRAAVAAALTCAFTLTWNGWFVGPLRPGDALILVTLVLLVIANPGDAFRAPPWWIKQLTIGIVVVAVLAVILPPDAQYLVQRTVLGATGQPTVDTKGSLVAANLGVAAKFVIAVAAAPLAFVGAALIDRRAARWLGIAFASGAALSGWAATADHFGTNVGHIITRLPNIGSRQVGFANQPNFLAAGVVLAVPFGFWLAASRNRREQFLGFVCLPGLLGGVYASGSRGGAVCAIAVLAVCIVLHPRTRPHAAVVAAVAAVLVVLAGGLFPSIGAEILKTTRLAGNSSTAGSDSVRAIVGAQGVRDFQHYPIRGIGLQASFDASQVYLQELASGGLVLFIAMQTYMLGAIATAWRYLRRNDMAVAILASLVATLGLDFFEADLTDRFYYVPAAILVAMVQTLRTDDAAAAQSSEVIASDHADAQPLYR